MKVIIQKTVNVIVSLMVISGWLISSPIGAVDEERAERPARVLAVPRHAPPLESKKRKNLSPARQIKENVLCVLSPLASTVFWILPSITTLSQEDNGVSYVVASIFTATSLGICYKRLWYDRCCSRHRIEPQPQ